MEPHALCASAGPSPAQHSASVRNDVFLFMTRALLQHAAAAADGAGPAHDSDRRQVYTILSAAFEDAVARRQRSAALCLVADDGVATLDFCFRQLLEVVRDTGLPLAATTTIDGFNRWVPLVTLERFRGWTNRSLLTRHIMQGAALAEAADLVKVLDRLQGLPPSAMGTLHVAHFAAVVASLIPQRSLSELVCLVAATFDGFCAREANVPADEARTIAHGVVAVILRAWASLESRPAARESLQRYSAVGFDRTQPLRLLVESASADGGLRDAATDPKLVREPAPLASGKAVQLSPVPTPATVRPESSHGGAEETHNQDGVDTQFWRDLVS